MFPCAADGAEAFATPWPWPSSGPLGAAPEQDERGMAKLQWLLFEGFKGKTMWCVIKASK